MKHWFTTNDVQIGEPQQLGRDGGCFTYVRREYLIFGLLLWTRTIVFIDIEAQNGF